MTTHPGLRHIGEHRAVIDRLEDNASARVLCAYCAWEINPGQEPATHGLCEDEACYRLAGEVITAATVTAMHTLAAEAFARYRVAKHWSNPAAAKVEWDAAEYRFRVALRLLVEDMRRRP